MNKSLFHIIVLASGNGTDLGAIIEAKKEGILPQVEVLGVISNKNLGALEKARNFGCPAVYVPVPESGNENVSASGRDETIKNYDQKLLAEIKKLGSPDLICLIGYMRILSPEFIRAFPKKIINVHPALLPKFGGMGMYGDHVHEAVLASGEKESGMTIHYVTEDVDAGEIILQKKCEITENETVTSLKAKVQALEKEGYVEALEKLSASLPLSPAYIFG